jgi:CheY-like chemotaxis protein
MKRILVAEDNDSNYLLMTFILKSKYELCRAVNGVEAVEKSETEHPDLILMDLKMPRMGGLEATRQIKAKLPDMPIIALTANAFDSDRQQAMDAGCNAFLAKPVSAAECLEVIGEFLG